MPADTTDARKHTDRRITYQVSDLQRQYREIVERARLGWATIRDKDGVTLLLAPAETFERGELLRQIVQTHLHLRRVLQRADTDRRAADLGPVAWASALDRPHLELFADELADALAVFAAGGPAHLITETIGDWQATAETWADPEARAQLLEAHDPPTGVEL
jgi:hypothetical protein